MTRKERAREITDRLKQEYPEAICALEYTTDYELLFATRLSAQCTDARVNIVTKTLFKKYDSLQKFADADLGELEQAVRTCGFFRVKARDIKQAAQMLLSDYGGKVPESMEDLLRLPGIGRKTANLVRGDIFGQPAIVTDTHCIRLANRFGLVRDEKDPHKVEMALTKLIDPKESADFCHRIVLHGRACCTARKPKCNACTLADVCVSFGKVM